MATETKAILEARLHAFEEVLDLIQRDLDDEDEPVNSVANDVEMLRHKTIERIKTADGGVRLVYNTKEFDDAAQDVWDAMTEVKDAFDSMARRTGSDISHSTCQRCAIFLGLQAQLELAFGAYLTELRGEVHNQ
jgi:sugar-specific transcriptional regulator TrmB